MKGQQKGCHYSICFYMLIDGRVNEIRKFFKIQVPVTRAVFFVHERNVCFVIFVKPVAAIGNKR